MQPRPSALPDARKLAIWLAGSAFVVYIGLRSDETAKPAGATDGILIAVVVLGVLFSTLTSDFALGLWPHRRPRLVAEEPNQHGYGWMSKVNDKDEMAGVFAIGIPFYNARDGGPPTATAIDVVAKVEAFDDSGRVAGPTYGHWRGIPEPKPSSLTEVEPQRVTFEPTHEIKTLDVVLRDSVFPNPSTDALLARPILKLSHMRADPLPPGRYRIEVSLRGQHLQGASRFKYELENPAEPDRHMRLRPL